MPGRQCKDVEPASGIPQARRLVARGVVALHRTRDLNARADPELAEDVADVGLDGLGTEEERGCDLGIRLAVDDQARDLEFALVSEARPSASALPGRVRRWMRRPRPRSSRSAASRYRMAPHSCRSAAARCSSEMARSDRPTCASARPARVRERAASMGAPTSSAARPRRAPARLLDRIRRSERHGRLARSASARPGGVRRPALTRERAADRSASSRRPSPSQQRVSSSRQPARQAAGNVGQLVAPGTRPGPSTARWDRRPPAATPASASPAPGRREALVELTARSTALLRRAQRQLEVAGRERGERAVEEVSRDARVLPDTRALLDGAVEQIRALRRVPRAPFASTPG